MRRDLAAETFLALRNIFFNQRGLPVIYSLRPKQNVQNDPFDDFVADRLRTYFAANDLDIAVIGSPGPLVSPDLLIYRPSLIHDGQYLSRSDDPTSLLALEVKKVERTSSGAVARASGMDYNTTPPCSLVRLRGADDKPVDTRASYLFACQEPSGESGHLLSALAVCDGAALNDDFELYLSIVQQRRKEIGLGTYGDGANRMRPMLVFCNPLGSPLFDRNATLIHACDDVGTDFDGMLRAVGVFTRNQKDNDQKRTFFCYRHHDDVAGSERFEEADPFPVPTRSLVTQRRGKFSLPWPVAGDQRRG